MPSTEPSTSRARRSAQSGQAIVLVAAAMMALLGLLALALDGGRAYVDRRELQNATDAAALAAGDSYWNTYRQGLAAGLPDPVTPAINAARQAAASVFALNVRLDPTAFYGGGGGPFSLAGYTLAVTKITPTAPNTSIVFDATASHQLPVSIGQALGAGPSLNIQARARSAVGISAQAPTLGTLSSGSCSGGADSVTIQSGSNWTLTGSLYSSGSIAVGAGPASGTVTGSVHDRCTNPVPSQITAGSSYPGSSVLPDPLLGYNRLEPGLWAPYSTRSPAPPGVTVELAPGPYPADPSFPVAGSGGCYFLTPGVYGWQSGLTVAGGVLSNRLTAPDDAFWNQGARCAGSISLDSPNTSARLPKDTYGVQVTTVRADAGTVRESIPSLCYSIAIKGGRGIQVAVSNLPGARGYRFYAARGGCTGPFGYVGLVDFPGTFAELNAVTSGCPYTPRAPFGASGAWSAAGCSLGYAVSPIFDSTVITPSWTVLSGECNPGGPVPGCRPPQGGPADDHANEDLCVPSSGGLSSCASPGAVQLYFPGSSCLNHQATGTGNFFGGPQFLSVLVYAPGCGAGSTLTGSGATQYVGTLYLPASALSLTAAALAPIRGRLDAYTAVLAGSGSLLVDRVVSQQPPPESSHLIRCTAPDPSGTGCPGI